MKREGVADRRVPSRDARHLEAWILLAGGAAVIVGALLPWAKAPASYVSTASWSGVDRGDGWIGVALAVPLVMFAVRRLSAGANIPIVAALVLSSVLSIFTVAATSDTTNSIRNANTAGRVLGMPAVGTATVGIGLWLVLFGTVAALFGSVVALTRRNA